MISPSKKPGISSVGAEQIVNLSITGGKIASTTLSGSKLENSTVTGGKIEKKTITEEQLANLSVSSSILVAPSAAPVEPTEGTTKVEKSSPARKICFSFKGNGSITKIELEHNLKTRLLHVMAQGSSAKEPTSSLVVTFEALTSEKVEVIFGSAPAAGALIYISVLA